MRSLLFAATLCLLILAACSGGAPQPTVTPAPTAVPPTQATVEVADNPVATLAATIGIPAPGTLIMPDTQNNPNAPTSVPITLDDLSFSQSGGIAGATLTIVLHGDGTLIRDGNTSKVTSEQVHQIEALLDGIHFYDLQGIFTGPSGSADTYRYTLTVNSAHGSRSITSQDGMTPPELFQVYDAIRNLSGAESTQASS